MTPPVGCKRAAYRMGRRVQASRPALSSPRDLRHSWPMRTAVLGHVEWVDFVRVAAMPRPGEIVRALDAWEEPAGGGGVAAVQLAKLAGTCTLFTALGEDERGRRVRKELPHHGVRVA